MSRVRTDYVKYRLARARETLAEAEMMVTGGQLHGATNG